MARNSFVWEVQVRREALDDEVAHLREVPYSLWRQLVGSPSSKVVTARDNQKYRVQVSAEYLGADDIRVTVSLARTRGLRRKLMRQTFIITPDNRFRV